LEAAERLFLDSGFAGTSMSEIAKGSGVTKSLIHHHFGSKKALWRAVKQRRFASYYDKQTELFAREGPSATMLRESMRVYFEFLRDNPKTMRLMSWVMLEEDVEATDAVKELRDAGIEHLRAAQAAGVLRADVPAPFILITFLGLVKAWFADPSNARETDPAVSDAYLDSAWALFAHGVMARESTAADEGGEGGEGGERGEPGE